MKPTAQPDSAIDWSAVDAMSDDQRHAAAVSDPDCRPIRPEDLALMPEVPSVTVIRRALGLSSEDFAARYRIPVGTIKDWERGDQQPDATARAYLRVIASEPDVVRLALQPQPAKDTGVLDDLQRGNLRLDR